MKKFNFPLNLSDDAVVGQFVTKGVRINDLVFNT